MLIQARVFKEEGFWVADIPEVDGSTFCAEGEDIVGYVKDYMESLGVEVEVTRENSKTLIIKPKDARALTAVMLKRMRGSRSLADVSKKKGLSRAMVHQYENGRREPSLTTMTKLFDSMGADFVITLRRGIG